MTHRVFPEEPICIRPIGVSARGIKIGKHCVVLDVMRK